jgi:stearoyl-CoA desaturase (delta-9 desaturase)
VSTVVLWHGTFTINSLSHVWGWRRYRTTDDSVNNPLLAILTLGEGWHNNHHYYQRSARQGFYWWEVDCQLLRAQAARGVPHRLGRPGRAAPRPRSPPGRAGRRRGRRGDRAAGPVSRAATAEVPTIELGPAAG